MAGEAPPGFIGRSEAKQRRELGFAAGLAEQAATSERKFKTEQRRTAFGQFQTMMQGLLGGTATGTPGAPGAAPAPGGAPGQTIDTSRGRAFTSIGAQQIGRVGAGGAPAPGATPGFTLGGPGGAAPATGQSAAMLALEESIERRGAQAQATLASQQASRGVFRSGAGAAGAARLAGATEANVAQARAGFAESAADRAARERSQRLSSILGFAGQAAGGLFSVN